MEKLKCKSKADGSLHRYCFEDTNTVFVYSKGKKRRGWRFSKQYFIDHYVPVDGPSESDQWYRRVRKVVKLLSESGLWPEILERFQNLTTVSWEDRESIKSIYWQHSEDGHRMDHTKEYEYYAARYPFMFYRTSDGYLMVETAYIYEISEGRMKPMYFGRDNTREKQTIAYAMQEKRRYSCRYTVNYDVSFEYDPDKNKAWYSEEYRNCGNGHYYLALNHSTALFCEDD